MAPADHIETRIRTLRVVAISIALALVVMIALALTGGATSDARVAPSGDHHHHKRHLHHQPVRHHKPAGRQHQVAPVNPAPPLTPVPEPPSTSTSTSTSASASRSAATSTSASASDSTSTSAPAVAAARTSVALSAASTASDPLLGEHFYRNPSSSVAIAERQLQAQGQTAQAATIQKVASHPEAIWLTSDSAPSRVPQIMSAAAAVNMVPVFVAYDIPWRDCSQYSSGGAASAAAYQGFIDLLTSGLGQSKAVVIVEPDALTEMSCLSSAQQQTYDQLISYAVQRIDTDANANVYVDAGHTGWQSPATEAAELQTAIGSARAGFAVNVSNFKSPAADIAYGDAISQLTGGRHYVIDTSRAGGNVAAGQWCNPAGAKIGTYPTAYTGHTGLDAYLWIKGIGESDGACSGGPAAGQFWLSYALSLAS